MLDVDQGDIHAYVIGEHGQSAFPVWSSAEVGSVKLDDFPLRADTRSAPCTTSWRSTS
jgi:malate/lactate dehydrogenase